MKKNVIALITGVILFSSLSLNGQTKTSKKHQKGVPVFSHFIYQGNDRVYKENPLKADEFYSPILQRCYPDPSITRKGDDYYLVNSSFAFFREYQSFIVKTWLIGHKSEMFWKGRLN